MARSWLVFLLLTNYLLVVGAGLVNRPERPQYSAAHPYVHSKTCQQRNYLRLDCFGTCNGDQHALEKSAKPPTPQQLLTTSKGLDLHCLPVFVQVLQPHIRGVAPYAPHGEPQFPTGFGAPLYAPPRRG